MITLALISLFMVGNKNSFGLFGFEFFLFLFLTIRGEIPKIRKPKKNLEKGKS